MDEDLRLIIAISLLGACSVLIGIELYRIMKALWRPMKIKYTRVGSIIPFQLPTRATDGSAMYDIYALVDTMVNAGETKLVSTGLCFEIPRGYVMKLYARSGTALKGQGLGNGVGIIDSDYRGEVKVMIHNRSKKPAFIVGATRIGQFEIVKQGIDVKFIPSTTLSTSERGEGGFGSTGETSVVKAKTRK